MYNIVAKENLTPVTKLFEVQAPAVARKARPGQFVIIRTHETGERLPLTLADCDRDAGTITLVFLQRGKSTDALAELEQGDSVLDVIGPLGVPYAVERFGAVVCVGGGIGIPAIYPVAHALAEAGNRVIVILAARSAGLLMLEDESAAVADEVVWGVLETGLPKARAEVDALLDKA